MWGARCVGRDVWKVRRLGRGRVRERGKDVDEEERGRGGSRDGPWERQGEKKEVEEGREEKIRQAMQPPQPSLPCQPP